MDKLLFISAIKAIKSQHDYDYKVAQSLTKAFPNAFTANLLPNNQYLLVALIQILVSEMNDKNEWIDYYCYECDFGRKNLKVIDGDVEIPLKTPNDLYNLLTMNKS